MIRTLLVLLNSPLLSSWFSSGVGAKAAPVGSLAYKSGRGFLAILLKGELKWVNTLCRMN